MDISLTHAYLACTGIFCGGKPSHLTCPFIGLVREKTLASCACRSLLAGEQKLFNLNNNIRDSLLAASVGYTMLNFRLLLLQMQRNYPH